MEFFPQRYEYILLVCRVCTSVPRVDSKGNACSLYFTIVKLALVHLISWQDPRRHASVGNRLPLLHTARSRPSRFNAHLSIRPQLAAIVVLRSYASRLTDTAPPVYCTIE